MSICIVYDGFHTTKVRSRDKDHMTRKAKNIYYLVFYRKMLLTPGIDSKK